ncbi:NfeD family protein [Maridesulfovibrio zosterae]|uniref:NfeD family protein n=1 Tax=Maridesulfovibrio zosterae TaxID=82171 RepID=UPI0004161FE9|nr:nodulation protein NfeD [Maridesulfovibrio zosterae]
MTCTYRIFRFLFFISITILLSSLHSFANEKFRVLSTEVVGSISPAQVSLLENIVEQAGDGDHDLILIRLDTPGGLSSSMRDMVKLIMNSEIPVCIWVGPDGAHAASAGAFLVAASQVAAMSPGTTLGAASPVTASGDDLPKTMNKKVKSDLVSLIKGIARKRDRNYDWYASAVEDGVSLNAQEAAALNVINFLATSQDDFLEQLGAKGVLIHEQKIRFSKKNLHVETYKPGLRYSVLSWLLDPQVAYYLLIGGILGLFFELSHPGAIFPGVVGGFCFLTSLYALSILPTNAAGLLLILLSGVLFILEIFIISYGLLSISAIVSLFVGSLILFRGAEMQGIPVEIIIGTVVSFSFLAGLLIYLVTKSQRGRLHSGIESLIGLEAEVLSFKNGRLKVRVRGEIWNAVSDENVIFERGSKVRVTQITGLTLKVIEYHDHNL